MCAGPEDALARVDQGFRFIALGSDARLLASAGLRATESVRAGLVERGLLSG